MTAIPLRQEICYPESDGQPVAESDLHRKEMIYLLDALEAHFLAVPDVYIAGNLLLYYAEGFPKKCVAPDVFVVKGIPRGNRGSYKLWKEGAAPVFVIEVTSSSTRREDVQDKKELYQRLGVEEYFLHDPLGDYLKPRLQGYRLLLGRYLPITPEEDGSMVSKTLGLILQSEDSELPEGSRLRLIDPSTGEVLRTHLESEAGRSHAEIRARAAEDENARLRAEIERLRRGQG
jgi:Putative restriction endonuclease